MDELTKNKRRAMRRKRNLIAKDLKTNKLYAPKVIESKKKRHRLSVRDIYLEDLEDEFYRDTIGGEDQRLRGLPGKRRGHPRSEVLDPFHRTGPRPATSTGDDLHEDGEDHHR